MSESQCPCGNMVPPALLRWTECVLGKPGDFDPGGVHRWQRVCEDCAIAILKRRSACRHEYKTFMVKRCDGCKVPLLVCQGCGDQRKGKPA